MKEFWTVFWAYWKWFCTALVTSGVLLLFIATLIEQLSGPKQPETPPSELCIEKGGTWNDDTQTCNNAA